jgi:pimeloyl-ACP methyl ester carboxylesterase
MFLLVTLASAAYDMLPEAALPVPPLDAAGHYVRAGQLTTHYEQWGTAGPAVVLVHGFLESAWIWKDVGPRLAASGHRVYALDVRGYGYTQRRGPYTLASDTDQLADFLGAVGLEAVPGDRPVLVGHSSGAGIVGNLARLQPATVAGVVFMDGDGTPHGVGPAWVHRLLLDPYATAALRLSTRHPVVAPAAYRSACGPGCPAFDAKAWTRPFRVAGAVPALKRILRRQLIGLTYRQERTIDVPSAVLYGADDPEMTADQAKATSRRLHTRQVLVIPQARHLAMLSSPAATATDLTTLVATLRAAAGPGGPG